MKNTKFPPFVFGTGLLFSSFMGNSQTPKQTVILMNSKPVLVEISPQGEILKIIKDEPALLKDYYIKAQEISVVAQADEAVKQDVPVLINQMRSEELETPIKVHDASIVHFDEGFATLTPEGIATLDNYILILKQKPSMFAIVRSLSLQNAILLSKNRLNGIKTYMRLRGIDSHRVITEPLEGATAAPEIKIIVTEGKTNIE